jgi:RNA polymerase sigma-70 factor (ECF subfamily)
MHVTLAAPRCSRKQDTAVLACLEIGLSESEADLIARAARDADAFGELYERYVDRIYNYIYYRVANVHDAEDLTARVFYRALAHIDEYRDRGAPFVAWLYRIAHNLVANWHRDRSRRHDIRLDDIGDLPERGDGPEHLAERGDEARVLLSAMGVLPAERQQLLILKFVDGMSNVEIARVMGRTEGAVKSLYHRTLIVLRDELAKRGAG